MGRDTIPFSLKKIAYFLAVDFLSPLLSKVITQWQLLPLIGALVAGIFLGKIGVFLWIIYKPDKIGVYPKLTIK